MKMFSQPLRQLAAVALVIINLILCIAWLRAPNIEKTLETADIRSEQGKAYIAEHVTGNVKLTHLRQNCRPFKENKLFDPIAIIATQRFHTH